jgi:predicted phosphodiesterase
MTLGLLSDVHGNRVALEAVVADGRRRGVDRWWVLGDLAAIGPEPVDTLELLVDLPYVRFVQGNTDRYVVTGQRPPPTAADVRSDPRLRARFDAVERSFSWTREQLEATDWLVWLAALDLEVHEVLADGTRLLGVHVLPGRDDGPGITPHRPASELRAAFHGADADIVAAGHTHQPTDRLVDSVRAVNLGSVSNPVTDDLRASFVIVHSDRHSHALEHRRVSYDRERFLAIVDCSGHPERDFIASFQLGQQVQHPSRRPGAPEPSADD